MSPESRLQRNIILTGFMGTGKSHAGKIIAEKTGYEFVDTDEIIERREQKSISEIFESEGEEKFREIEARTLTSLLDGKRQVISTGGGAITYENNFQRMREAGVIVALTASVNEIHKRVKNDVNRPLLNVKGSRTKIKEMLEDRMDHYLKADLKIDTDNKSPEDVADEIIKKIDEIKILK